MSTSIVRALSIAAMAGFLMTPVPASAEDNGTNNTGTVDCGDTNTKNACAECCTTPGSCVLTITCCPLSGPCTVVNKPSSSPLPLKLKLVVGGWSLQFQRTIKADAVDVKVKASLLKSIFPKGVNARVRVTGPDAQLAGLVWPVAFLGQGDGAATSLANAGIDATINGTPVTCQSLFPAEACTDMAVGLSRTVQGAIGVAAKPELNPFLDAVNGMGLGPCGTFF